MTPAVCRREEHNRCLGNLDGRESGSKTRPMGLIDSRKVFPKIAHLEIIQSTKP